MNTLEKHTTREHSRISPSGLGNLAVCPSYQNDNSRPVHPTTAAGLMIHAALEERNLSKLPDDLKPIAQLGLDFWDQLRAETPGWKEFSEPKIAVTEEMSGHLDLLRVGSEKALILDFKAGYHKQATAATNVQQKAYTVGVFKAYPEVQEVTVYLAYLRLQEVDCETFTREQLPQLELEVLAILRRAQAAQKGELVEHRPDPSVCTYCAKAGICPALAALAIPTARAYAQARPETLTVPEAYDPALISDPAVMAKALVVADIAEKWADSVKKHALELRLSQGIEIPGTTLVSKNGTKSILDPNTAYQVAANHGLDHNEFMTCVEVSPAKLLKAAEAKAPRGKKKLAAEALEDDLRDSGALHVGAETFYLRRVKSAGETKPVD